MKAKASGYGSAVRHAAEAAIEGIHLRGIVGTARSPWLLFGAWLFAATVFLWRLIGYRGPAMFLLSVDFRPYFTGAAMLRAGVRDGFYSLATQFDWQQRLFPMLTSQDRLLPYLNPPFVVIPLAVTSSLPAGVAFLLWTVLNAALLCAVYRVAADELTSVKASHIVAALAALLTFPSVFATILQGQVSFILVLSPLLAWRSLRRGNEMSAGLWLAALAVRPQLLLAPGVALIAQRRWRSLAGMAGACAVLAGVSLLLIGPKGMAGYIPLMRSAWAWREEYGLHPEGMQTVRALVDTILPGDNSSAAQAAWMVGAAACLGLLGWIWRNRTDGAQRTFDRQWAVMGLAILFTSPYAYYHDLTLLVMPGLLTACICTREDAGRDRFPVLLAFPLAAYLAAWLWFFPLGGLRLQWSVLVMLGWMVALALPMLRRTVQVSQRSPGATPD